LFKKTGFAFKETLISYAEFYTASYTLFGNIAYHASPIRTIIHKINNTT